MKQIKWTKERYEQIVFLAYSGFTGMMINKKMGNKHASSNLKTLGLDLATIRKHRREGTSLDVVVEGIDWSFLKEREERRREANTMLHARNAKKKAPRSADEILQLLREIHAALCKPNTSTEEAA